MSSVETVLSGDTIRVVATFREYAVLPAVGDLIDPDDQEATITVYDAEQVVVLEDDATREAEAIFHYDWTAPDEEGTYFFEFKGLFDALPQLTRVKLNVKFKPVA